MAGASAFATLLAAAGVATGRNWDGTGMTSFGEKLKAAREDRGIELSEVSAATNVGVHLLEALEANDFARLPGGPFNKGFVRAYARHIGIDPEEAIGAYSREERSQGIRTPDVGHEMPHAETRLLEFRNDGDQTTLILDWIMVKRILMATGAVLLLLAGTWLLWPSGGSEQDQEGGLPAMPPSQPVATATGDRPPLMNDSQEADPAAESSAESAPATSPPAGETAPPPDSPVKSAKPDPTRPETRTVKGLPPPSPAPAVATSLSSLEIIDFGVGTGVSQRQLTGRGDRFPVGTQVWFWTRTLGGSKGDLLMHVWLHEGRPVMTYERTLGGPHWRNSSRKTLSPGSRGQWTVEARDSRGRVVARTTFECTGK